jgi:hypothetical protein
MAFENCFVIFQNNRLKESRRFTFSQKITGSNILDFMMVSSGIIKYGVPEITSPPGVPAVVHSKR